MVSSVDPSPSQGLMSSTLLEKIDKLFACNAGEYVDLPQLVVVGDQSSGKSSVLEGLTGLPFPRDSGLCTRYATHITFRRSKHSQITVSIIPSEDSSPERQQKLRQWRIKPLQSLDVASFRSIMEQVTAAMEIGSEADSVTRTFSEDVLRLEVSGPSQEHFSVIDVPGIFKRTTQGLTTKNDITLVDRMVRGYMSNPRSVMLVVIPCNVDIATQEILERAEDLDKNGIRTLGVLTKPDLIDQGGEGAVIDLLEGRKHHLKLGWHLLRNPGQSDLKSGKDRKAIEEDFFKSQAPWNNLDKRVVGVTTLRARLQTVLETHIRREFPEVRGELSQRLRKAQIKLDNLGPPRQTKEQQLQVLVKIALAFQNLVSDALQAGYGRAEIFKSNPALRLATRAINRGEQFSQAISSHGHSYYFDSEGDSDEPEWNAEAKTDDFDELNARTVEDHPEISDLTLGNVPVSLPSDDSIIDWIEDIYHDSRGFEIGTFDSTILGVILREQASGWTHIALGYISDIIALVHGFIVEILHYVAPSQRLSDSVKSLLLDNLIKKYQKAMDHTQFLLDVELAGTPATYNHYFSENLRNRRTERLRGSLEAKTISAGEHGKVVRLDDIVTNHPLSNEQYTTLEIHDILCAYYKVAKKRFIDSVRMQVADTMLVTGKDTPLTLFSAELVAGLDPDTLEDIAGEEVQIKQERSMLEKEIRLLKKSKAIIG